MTTEVSGKSRNQPKEYRRRRAQPDIGGTVLTALTLQFCVEVFRGADARNRIG